MWGAAFADLSAAHREGQLAVEDLERLAVAAYMVGRDDACEEAWIAAHHAWLGRGEAERAARCAFWQALGLFFRGDLAPAADRRGIEERPRRARGRAANFPLGQEMWDWVLYGNPIPGMLVAALTERRRARSRQVLDGMLRERAGANGRAVLTNPVNIGIGTK